MKKQIFTLLTLLVLCVTGAWAKETSTLPTSGSFAASTTKYELSNSEAIVSNSKIYWASRSSITVGAKGVRPYRMAYALEVSSAANLTFNVTSTTTTARTITGQAYEVTEPFFNVWKNTSVDPAQTLEAYLIAVNAKEAGERTAEETAIHNVAKLAAVTSSSDANKKLLICEVPDASLATASGSAINHACPTTNGGTNSFEVTLPAAGKYVIFLDSSGSGCFITSIDVEEVVMYTITYDKGANGTGSIVAGSKKEGTDFTLSSETFTRDGYLQTGWATTDGGAKVYELGDTYTTDANITLFPVWSKLASSTTLFDYTEGKTLSELQTAGWTFANAGTYGNTDATVDLESAFGANFPSDAASAAKNDNQIAFAKNTAVWAKYTFGSPAKIGSFRATFYVGSSSQKTFTITFCDSEDNVLHTTTVVHTAGTSWHETIIDEFVNKSNVSYIKINGMASSASWIVLSDMSISSLYDEYISVSTNASRNFGTMVTPAGKKLNFAAVEDDVKAYVSPGLNDGKTAISIQKVGIVPAETPIIIKTTAQGATVNVPVTDEDADDVESINKLVAGDGTTDATPGTYTYFYIASDQFHKATSGTLKSGKAYLKLETAALSRDFYGFDEGGETTGIQAVETKKLVENNKFYNLAGQEVENPTKGLYIVNGKKVIIK